MELGDAGGEGGAQGVRRGTRCSVESGRRGGGADHTVRGLWAHMAVVRSATGSIERWGYGVCGAVN